MIKLEAQTLEDALLKASEEFSCSVADIEYEIIEHPRKGFLGIGKRMAKIVACVSSHAKAPVAKDREKRIGKNQRFPSDSSANKNSTAHRQDTQESLEYRTHHGQNIHSLSPQQDRACFHKEDTVCEKERAIPTESAHSRHIPKHTPIEEKFFQDEHLDAIAHEVEEELNALFAHLPFDIERIKVVPFDDNTLYIEFKGEDSALLIGKEGYRYKALSYLLFNWVNNKYGLMIRLEIAEFLKNQEEMVAHYLIPMVQNVKRIGRGQTRPLDGVLAHIALRHLRKEFPNKYVSFRVNSDGERYVIVNDFYR